MSNKEERLEELEDELYAKLQPLDFIKKRAFLERVTAEIALLTSYNFTNDEAAFLMSIITSPPKKCSAEQLSILRNSLSTKVGENSSCDTCPSWAVRCAYSLLLDDPLIGESSYISDQMEIIFNAAYFCDVPLVQLEKIILCDV